MTPEEANRLDGPTLADVAEYGPRERMRWWEWVGLFVVVAVSGYAMGYAGFWVFGLLRAAVGRA